MAGRTMLQVMLIAVAFGSHISQAQFHYQPDGSGSAVLFPSEQFGTDTRASFNPPMVQVPRDFVRAQRTPRCARGNSVFNNIDAPCESDEDYNFNVRSLVNQLLAQTHSVNEIISDPMLRVILNDTLTPAPIPAGVGTRFNLGSESPVCDAQEELIFPQRAKTPKNDWVFVVNQDNVKQALRVERCIGEGRSCNLGVASTRDIATTCRQKYVYRRMLVVGTNNVQPEEVLMPSCCVCYIQRHTFDIAPRIDVNSTIDASGETVPTGQPAAQPAAQPTPAAQPPQNQVFNPNVRPFGFPQTFPHRPPTTFNVNPVMHGIPHWRNK